MQDPDAPRFRDYAEGTVNDAIVQEQKAEDIEETAFQSALTEWETKSNKDQRMLSPKRHFFHAGYAAALKGDEENTHHGIRGIEMKPTPELNAAPLFTKGPWQAEMHGQNVLACDGQMMICNVRGWGYLTGVGALNLPDEQSAAIQDANVRLIAAAPALYEALKAVVIMASKGQPRKLDEALTWRENDEKARAMADAALALAEGKE